MYLLEPRCQMYLIEPRCQREFFIFMLCILMNNKDLFDLIWFDWSCASEDLKCWGAQDTTCRLKAKNITPSLAWSRQAQKEEMLNNPWKGERGPSSIRPTLELFQRQRRGNISETGLSTYGLIRAHKSHQPELNTYVDWHTGTCACKHTVSTYLVIIHQVLTELWCMATEQQKPWLGHLKPDKFYIWVNCHPRILEDVICILGIWKSRRRIQSQHKTICSSHI